MTSPRLAAAQARAAGVRAPADRPQQRRSHPDEGVGLGRVRVQLGKPEIRTLERNGLSVVHVGGYACTTDQPYEMYDYFGPYVEQVTGGAFGATLAASPLVEFTVNHGAGGAIPMAHTRNGMLDLVETAELDEDGLKGLRYDAFVDPTRSDVANVLKAMERGDLAEASFKFRITLGAWSPDWTEFHIEGVDLDRGDVSTVNFGANPNATSGLRSQSSQRKPGLSEVERAQLLALSLL